MTETIAGLILAGGKSTRFGTDKAAAPLAGRPMLQWVVDALAGVCEEIVIVAALGQELPAVATEVPVTIARDLYAAKGPLAGLVSGFQAVRHPLCFAVSCDVPLVRPELVGVLAEAASGHDIACPLVGGFMEPLVAVYRPAACFPVFRDFVERDILKITAAFGPLDLVLVAESDVRSADPDLESFLNANRPEVLEDIARRLSARYR